MQDTIEIDILELLRVLWKRVVLIAVSSAIGFMMAYLISRYVIHPKYTSSVSLYVNNSAESAVSAVNINDLNASQKLVNTYIVILEDDEVIEQLGQRLMAEFTITSLARYLPLETVDGEVMISTGALRGTISMSSVNNTEVLKISTVTKDPYLSARICTIMTEIAPDVLTRVVKAGSVEVIGAAKPDLVPTSPRVFFNSAVGFVLGFVISVFIVLLMYFLDNTVKGEEDLLKHYKIPVLGEIPDFAAENYKGEYTSYGGQGSTKEIKKS